MLKRAWPASCVRFSVAKQESQLESRTRSHADSSIIQIDQNLFETKLDRLATEDDPDPQRHARRRGRRDHRGRQIRTQEGRKAYRAGHYERTLTAKAGRLELRVPKLKGAVFESAVIERYRRRVSVEEALMEMCLAG